MLTVHNTAIIDFNRELAALAKKYGAVYIDLNSHFLKDGFIDDELTVDGIHLSQKGEELWMSLIRPYVEMSEQ